MEGEYGSENYYNNSSQLQHFKSNMPKGLESYILGCLWKIQAISDTNENLASFLKSQLDLDNHGYYFLCVQIKDPNVGFSFVYGNIADYYLRMEVNGSQFLVIAKKMNSYEAEDEN